MNINEKIKQRRLQLGLSAEEVADALNISRATMYRYEGGQIEKMPLTIVEPLAEILDVSPYELFGWSDAGTEKSRRIPLVGTIACGSPITAEENIEDYISAPLGCEADFALRCKGDSMIRARICDGDIVFIHAQSDCSNGEIAAVLIGDEATLKRVYKQQDSITLMPENSEYSPLVFRREQLNEIRILGKAVGFLSYF
jgi:SOS regulatory protein LexA